MPIGGNIVGSGPPESLWELVKEWDWTDQGSHTFVDGVAQEFDLIDWTSRNTANADSGSPSVSGADGLKFVLSPSTTTSRMYTQNQTAPLVFADLDDIVSGYGPSDTLAIQALVDTSVSPGSPGASDNNYLYAGLVVSDGTYGNPGSGIWYHVASVTTVSESGSTYQYMTRNGCGTLGGVPIDTQVTTGEPTLLEMIVYPGAAAYAVSASITETSFPDPLGTTTYRAYGDMELENPEDMTDNPSSAPDYTLKPGGNTKIGMWAGYHSSGSRVATLTVKFSKLRVLKRKA